MYLYTIGFTQKSAEQFFERIKYYQIQILVDVRLKNDSQLCGFARKRDLPYFLGLHNCNYEHCINYAPSEAILAGWKKELITWAEYKAEYMKLMNKRKSVRNFITSYYGVYESVCLLCAEPTPEHCHRRLLAEMIRDELPDTEIIHI